MFFLREADGVDVKQHALTSPAVHVRGFTVGGQSAAGGGGRTVRLPDGRGPESRGRGGGWGWGRDRRGHVQSEVMLVVMVVVVCRYQDLGENDETRTHCTDIHHKHLGEKRWR